MSAQQLGLSREQRRWLAAFGLVGAATFGIGLFLAPARAWSSYLVNAYYFLTLGLGGLVLITLLHLSRAGFGVVIKRVAEGVSAYLPVGAISMLLLLPGVHAIYAWAAHGPADAHGQGGKSAYFALGFFALRMCLALGLWVLFGALLRKRSTAQDTDSSLTHTTRSVALSAGFLLTFAYSFSMASVDWVMSLEPHWSSTIFAFYNMSGLLTAGLAAVIVIAIVLRRSGALRELNPSHLHDLGKLLFGMSTFWAYLWISQYLLIWYANMPEETAYYIARTRGGWGFLFYLNLVINWLIPFLSLLPRAAKRSETQLLRVAGLLLFGRWLDLYLMVAPSAQPTHTGVGVIEVLTFLGFASLFILVVTRALRSAPLIARGDPYLVESLHHHQ